MKFLRKATVVEAIQVSELIRCAGNDWKALPEWIRAIYDSDEPKTGIVFTPDSVYIQTPRGRITGDPGEWIVMKDGEISSVKADVFEKHYDPEPLP